jgi:hypothetical protein
VGVGNALAGASAKSPEAADGCVCTNRCSGVQRCRKGATVVPTPAFRDFQSLCSRAGLPRGANAPRSCVAARTFAGEKNDFCDARTHVRRSGGREPAVGVGNALATPIPLTSGDTRHVQRQERRTSARRGCGKDVHADKSAIVRQTAEGTCADGRCIRVQGEHGGLTPPALGERTHIVGDARLRFATAFCFKRGAYAPALVLRCERLPAKNDFCDARTHVHKRAAGVSPPWVAETHLQHRYRSRPGTLVTCGDKSGGRQPAVGGGSLPEQTFPTVVIALKAHGPSDAELARALRLADPPVVPRIQDGLVLLDLRSVFPEQDSLLVQAVSRACTNATA